MAKWSRTTALRRSGCAARPAAAIAGCPRMWSGGTWRRSLGDAARRGDRYLRDRAVRSAGLPGPGGVDLLLRVSGDPAKPAYSVWRVRQSDHAGGIRGLDTLRHGCAGKRHDMNLDRALAGLLPGWGASDRG